MDDTFLQQLTSSQRKAVLHTEGPLLVLAGPGSGKTRVITYRLAALVDSGVRPQNICAITFTNKAAEQMRLRANALGACGGAHISTFHSLCVRILRRYADRAGVKANFSIYDTTDQAGCMKQAVKDCELDTANFSPARMLDAVSTLKNNLKDVESFRAEADDFFSKALARIYDRYQAILTERNSLDFDDLLMKTAFLLRDCPDVCSELSRRFRFLLIDEYQDTNHAQYKIAKALVCEHNNICATGDPDQSIYRWRGADIRNILAFEQDWPDAVVVKLEENFRSTAGILERADKLISANINRRQKTLIPTKAAGKDVVVDVFEDELQEANGVTAQVQQLADEGTCLNDIAVFYRINAQSRVLEEAFIRNKIPYQIVRGVEFYSRKEIRDLLGYLKVLVNPDDEVALLRIINNPARGIGKTTLEKVRSYADSQKITFFDALKKTEHINSLSVGTKTKISAFVKLLERFKGDLSGKVAPLAERVFIESGLKKSLADSGTEGQTALENVNELLNSAAQYDTATEQPALLDYLQQIALFSDVDAYDAESGRVALMTLHAAKGLEFEEVFITGLEEGLLPHEKSRDDPDEIEEERRLFFVGMTRAKTGLHISCAKYRTVWGQMLRTVPSPFLYELGIDFGESEQQDIASVDIAQSDFAPGRLIRHKIFGLGRIKEFIDMGADSIVVVQFNSGRTKSLMLKYADLEVV